MGEVQMKRKLLRPLWILALCLTPMVGCNACEDPGAGPPPVSNNTNQNATTNTNTGTNTVVAEEPIPARQGCAAGGTAAGGGVDALNCLGPDNPSGFEARGGGVVWQPGASRVILKQ